MTSTRKTRDRIIAIQRAYEEPGTADGYRALVDHFWPRGRSKADLRLDVWARDIAPTPQLIHWFGHEAARWPEFRTRYIEELSTPEMREKLAALLKAAGGKRMTLVYGARDPLHNQAVVLRDVLEKMQDTM